MLFLVPLLPLCNSLFLVCFSFAGALRWRTFIKVYLLYWLMILLLIFLKLFILVWLYIDFYVIAIHTTGINLAILLIIIFVSNIVLMNPIDYLGMIESVLFLVYICPLQFSMIMFILTVYSFSNINITPHYNYLFA